MESELSVEVFLRQAQKWSRKDILIASQGLRDLQLQWDNRRRLTHTISDGQISTEFSVDLDNTEKVSVIVSNSGFDPTNEFHSAHSSIYFTLSKDQLAKLGKFVYFSSLDPEEPLQNPMKT